MKKRSFKISALLMALILVVATLAACGSSTTKKDATSTATSTATAGPVEELKPITISMLISSAPPPVALEETTIAKNLVESLKVKLNIEYVATDAGTREGILIASGDYPDLIYPTDNSASNAGMGMFLKGKVFIPLNKLIDQYGTNIKAWYPNDMLNQYKKADGNIYYLPEGPGSDTGAVSGMGYYVQLAVLKDAGWPKIQTIDQYFSLIENYKKKFPTINGKSTIGFEFQTDGWKFDSVTNGAALLFGYQDDGGYLIDVNDKTATAKLYNGTENDKNNLSFLNQQYNKGLIDPECFVDKYDQWLAKVSSGRVLGYNGWSYEEGTANDALTKQGMDDRRFVSLPLVWKEGTQEKYANLSTPALNRGIGITVSCKDPVRVFQYLDALLSQDNVRSMYFGEKGVDYNVDGAGKITLTQEQITNLGNSDYRAKKGIGLAALLTGSPAIDYKIKYADGNPLTFEVMPEFIANRFTNSEKEFLSAYNYKVKGDAFKFFYPTYGFGWSVAITGDSAVGKESNKKSEVVHTYAPKLITDKTSNFTANWNEYKAKLDQINFKTMEDFMSSMITKRLQEGRIGE